ncbi:MAG TPA: aminoglycoside phosphotransferase, partial [Rhodanobacteraceae bacterium]|nr:aminoglycoside phosphotransferase [Rhodanobacteraceae bacterium]
MNPPQPVPVADAERSSAQLAFARAATGDDNATIAAVAADASARSYWRVMSRAGSAVLMDAAGMPQVIAPWLDVAARLRAAGLNAPQVLAEDLARGFL